MSVFCLSMCGQPSLPSLASRLVRPVNVLTIAALCMSMSGCGGTGSLSVTGFVSLDGRPTPAEILIEQLDRDGNQAGRSVTAYADEQGEFSVSIDPASGGAKLLDCRFVVRVSQLSSSGLPAAFDENALPEKKIRLRRVLRDNDSLHILLTQ